MTRLWTILKRFDCIENRAKICMAEVIEQKVKMITTVTLAVVLKQQESNNKSLTRMYSSSSLLNTKCCGIFSPI